VNQAHPSGDALKVLVTDSLHPAGQQWLIDRGVQLSFLADDERSHLALYAAGVDALIIRTATKVTERLLQGAPSVRVVGRAGAGVDNIDVESAQRLGVVVVSAPEANTISAAEHTIGLLLAVARSTAAADARIKAGRWESAAPLGLELYGETMGVIGFGRIGQRVAALARAFGMKVLVNDPVIDQAAVERIGVEVVERLEDLLPRVGVVTVHTPLDTTTRGLLNGSCLALLPDRAVVINCARGGIVDETALLEALDRGQLRGAGLDVFVKEPPQDFRLLEHPLVVATPHWGAHTEAAKEKVGLEIAESVWRALQEVPGA